MSNPRKAEWQTHLGNMVSVEGCSDEHLANTIQWLSHYKTGSKTLAVLKREAKNRGLTKDFLDRAQFPYKDGKGNWIVWDFKASEPKVVGSYLRG